MAYSSDHMELHYFEIAFDMKIFCICHYVRKVVMDDIT